MKLLKYNDQMKTLQNIRTKCKFCFVIIIIIIILGLFIYLFLGGRGRQFGCWMLADLPI
jgi:hypothetical protein